ncbi:unnamed protein product [Phytophthora lilii]|uniref:Unnamed protein product n=1 Tax=Phytophthora lilii TaxID=2077276 RepID=A0A9W6TBM5_9STRA|nr:unnamed protein product [Phytophthora lilii]
MGDLAFPAAKRALSIIYQWNGVDTRALTPTPDQQLETALAGVRQEMTALHDDLRQEVSTSLTRICTEMQELQGNLANFIQGMTNMLTTLNQAHTIAQAAQQMAADVRNGANNQPQSNPPHPGAGLQVNMELPHPDENVEMTSPT